MLYRYIVTYDLNKKGQDYEAIVAQLKTLGACRIQASVWLLESAQAIDVIYRILLSQVDGNDALTVAAVSDIRMTGEYVARGLLSSALASSIPAKQFGISGGPNYANALAAAHSGISGGPSYTNKLAAALKK